MTYGKLEEAGDNPRKLLNLRKRMARIRVFDPACGSGNFLVIAYKQMREIEAEINKRRGEADRPSPTSRRPTFAASSCATFRPRSPASRSSSPSTSATCSIAARKLALLEFLPLDTQNWITCGNALRLDWLSICPPTGNGREDARRRFVWDTAGSGADRFRE
jgi:hypothetical protein